MTLDDDLLQLHLHAKEISPDGVQALIQEIQQQRSASRTVVSEIEHICAKNDEVTNFAMMRAALDRIHIVAGNLALAGEVHTLHWRDYTHG